MKQAFLNNLDFVYLFYCAAFFFLGTACLILSFREKSKKTLPWIFLSFFGFTHGLNEWLDMIAVSFMDPGFLVFERDIMLAFSFLCLLEFSRQSLYFLKKIRIPVWVYLPLLPFISADYFQTHCLACLNASLRYFLGFPGAIGVFFAISAFGRQEKEDGNDVFFRCIPYLFLFYAVVTGLIVSKSHYALSQIVNSERFLSLLGIPVQVVRGVLATLIAFLFFHRATKLTISTHGAEKGVPLVRYILASFLVLYMSFLFFGFRFVSVVAGHERAYLNKIIRTEAKLLKNALGSIELDSFVSGKDRIIYYTQYRKLHSRLTKLAEISTFAKNLYIVTLEGDRPQFTIGSRTQVFPYHFVPAFGAGAPVNHILDAFHSKQTTIYGEYQDQEGHGAFSIFVPLQNSQNEVVILLGIDLDGRKLDAEVLRVRLYAIFVIMAFIMLLIVGYAFLIIFALKSIELEVQKNNLDKALVRLKETQGELARSEETFRGILNNSPNPIFGFDRDLKLIFWNSGAEDTYGYKKYEVIDDRNPMLNRKITDLFGIKDLEPKIANVFSSETLELETIHKTKHGSIDVAMTLFPVKDSLGHILFAIGLVQDISVHKKYEEKLTAAHAQLKAVLDAATKFAIIATDMHGVIKVFNTGAENMFGVSADDVVEKQTTEQFHLESEISLCAEEFSARSGRPIKGFEAIAAIVQRDGLCEREWTGVRRDGTHFPALLTVSLLRNNQGVTIGYLVIGIDLTQRKAAEKAFVESQQRISEERDRLKKIADSLGAGLYLVNRNFEVVWVNETLEKWFGKFDSVEGKKCFQAYKFRHTTCEDCPIHKTLKTGQHHVAEQRVVFGDGRIMDFLVTSSPIKNEKGEVGQVLELSLDITDRKRMTELLEYERALSRNVIDSIGEELMILDCRQRTILDVNRHFLEQWHLKKEDVIGKKCDKLSIHFCPPCEACEIDEVVVGGRSVTSTHIHQKKDGTKVYADVTLSPLKDEKGKVIGVIHLAKDVTERKKLEDELRHYSESLESLIKDRTKALQKSELMFRKLFESAQDGILIIDFESGNILGVNPYLLDLLQCSRDDIHGFDYTTLPFLVDAKIFEQAHQELRQKVSVYYDDVIIKTCSHKDVDVELRASLYFVEDKKVIQFNIRDLSERKKLEKVKAEFVSMVSHELRTPLSAIKEGVEIVADGTQGKLNKSQVECLTIALSNIKRLNRLIGDILDISKIQSNLLRVNFAPCNIYELIDHVYSLARIEIEKRGMVFVTNLEKALPLVYADRDRLIQVLVNLLNNAVKFTREHSKITLLCRRSGDFIEFSVKDEGAGITPEELSRLFGKFVQLDSTLVRRVGGTGLGLYISRNLIEAMGGRIWAESELGVGSIFKFSVPIYVESK
jgi:PAS domain S-box-containing protein